MEYGDWQQLGGALPEFREKELVTGQFADILCGSLTKENLCHAFVKSLANAR